MLQLNLCIPCDERAMLPTESYRHRLKRERAELREEVLQTILEEGFLKQALHGFELFRFGYFLPQARLATIASLDRALEGGEDPDLKRIRWLFVQEHLQAGRREAALAYTH